MECLSCNAYNPDGLMFCSVCGSDLPKSNPVASMAKPKLAIFHVEEAVLDNAAGERVAKRKGLKGKRFDREVAANLEKSVSRVGVRDYINKLARDNFTIAFISGLDQSYQFRLQDRLRHLGYPVMSDTSGPLVLMGSSQDNIRSLAKRYDITFVYSSSGAGTAKQMNVPGVYATVNDYIGDTNNPYIAPQATPAPYSLSGLRPEPTPAPYTLANPVTLGPMRNPVPKPRRKTNKKTGKKRREPAKIYFERLMANKSMNKDFPDRSQRSAVALRHVEEEYGQRGVDSVTKTWSPMANPTTEGLPIYSGQPTGAKNLGMVTAVVQVGRGFMKDIGEGIQDFYRALIGGRQSMTEKRMMLGVAEMHHDLTKAVEQKGGNAIGNVRLDYEHPTQGGDITLIATADALKVPKKNPASNKKLKKAKDAYKKFHGGKTPDEITTAKVDVGDVWYSLGECWTIGYMSPKENGNEHQKFIHEMNEESKDGNYPILYATMPENGEPMLIIKGGSMKIGMRDGKAWLID